MNTTILTYRFLFVFVLFNNCLFASVQNDTLQQHVQPVNPQRTLLKKGTPITFRTMQRVTSRDGFDHQIITLEIHTDVSTDGKTIVFNHNNYGEAEVTTHRAGAFGKGGKVNITAISVRTVNGQRVNLEGITVEKQGRDQRGLAFGMSIGIPIAGLAMSTPPGILVFGITGFFIKGKEAVVPVGTFIRATVSEDVEIAL